MKMRKKIFLGFVTPLVVGLLIITILPLWFALQARIVSRTTDNSPIHRSSSPGGTITSFPATSPTSTSPTSSTSTPTPIAAHPTVTATSTPQSTATIGLNALSDYGKITYGLAIMLYGSKFEPGEPVQLIWEYQQRAQFNLATVTADSQGLFTYHTSAPSDPDISKVNVAATGKLSKRFAIMSVPEIPDLVSNPYPAGQGDTVHSYGGNFGSDEKIILGSFMKTSIIPLAETAVCWDILAGSG